MTKKIFAILSLMGIVFLGHAQSLTPAKGDKMVSLNLGAGSAVGISAPLPNLGTYTVSTPTTTWLDRGLALNVEFRWMFAEKWSLKAKGGLSYGFAPEYNALPGTADGNSSTIGAEDLPNYSFVPRSNKLQYQVAAGFDRFVATKFSRLSFYYGIEAGFAYGRNIAHADDESYNGKAAGEAFSIKGAFVTGFHYAISEALYAGIELNPVSYSYNVNNLRPQAGLRMLSSDSHRFDFLSCPTIKLGFRF